VRSVSDDSPNEPYGSNSGPEVFSTTAYDRDNGIISWSYPSLHPSEKVDSGASAQSTPPVTPPTAPVQPVVPVAPVQSTIPTAQTVSPTPSKVIVNGVEQSFEAYNIDGSNYFKLRDIAFVLNGTAKQFEVGYDNATQAITMTSNMPYTVTGGEMVPGDGTAKTATPTPSVVYLNGQPLNFAVYYIAGSNFFKLVDVMTAMNVGVTYNQTTGNISIDTNSAFMGVVTVQ
jgi:hypothetical protein